MVELNIKVEENDYCTKFSYLDPDDPNTKIELEVRQCSYFNGDGYGLSSELDGVDVITWHRRYSIGKSHNYSVDEIFEIYPDEDWHSFDLYMYDHGMLAFSMSSFNDRWDSGQIGYIFVKREFYQNEEDARRIAQGIVDEQNDIELGNVYEYILLKKKHCECCGQAIEDEVIDQCGWFVGEMSCNGMDCYIPDEFIESFKKHFEVKG